MALFSPLRVIDAKLKKFDRYIRTAAKFSGQAAQNIKAIESLFRKAGKNMRRARIKLLGLIEEYNAEPLNKNIFPAISANLESIGNNMKDAEQKINIIKGRKRTSIIESGLGSIFGSIITKVDILQNLIGSLKEPTKEEKAAEVGRNLADQLLEHRHIPTTARELKQIARQMGYVLVRVGNVTEIRTKDGRKVTEIQDKAMVKGTAKFIMKELAKNAA